MTWQELFNKPWNIEGDMLDFWPITVYSIIITVLMFLSVLET